MKFKKVVKQKIGAIEYEKLSKTLGCSKKRARLILNTPERMEAEELEKFRDLLSISAFDLINGYDCGISSINIEDERYLLANDLQQS